LREQQYRVETYRYNDDITFYVLLDRNFVSEFIQIVNIIMNNLGRKYIPLSKEQKIIAAHQAFFQLCNIYCEPNIALYEYADQHDHESVSEELLQFRIGDDLPVNVWINLALQKELYFFPNTFIRPEVTSFDKKEMVKKLNHFEANYIIVKKAISFKKIGLNNYETMVRLMEWLYHEFIFTAPSIIFLNYYLCPNKPGLKKMIKNYNIDGIRNATWDICFLQTYFSRLKNEVEGGNNERWLACSNDNAVKKVIPLLFAENGEADIDFHKRLKSAFIESWGKNTGLGRKIYEQWIFYQNEAHSPERKQNKDSFRKHIKKIKQELDSEIFE
jgi:hypothetical protein